GPAGALHEPGRARRRRVEADDDLPVEALRPGHHDRHRHPGGRLPAARREDAVDPGQGLHRRMLLGERRQRPPDHGPAGRPESKPGAERGLGASPDRRQHRTRGPLLARATPGLPLRAAAGPAGSLTETLVHLIREPAGEPAGALVLNHGRGTGEHDLYGLLDELDPDRRLLGVTPGGPLTDIPPGGRHWYRVERVGFPDPATFQDSYGRLTSFLDELLRDHGIAWSRAVIG